MRFDDIFITIIFMVMTIIGAWGLSDFEKFFISWENFMDSRNTMNINYPKGIYAKVVLKLTLYMCLIMGILGLITLILVFLNILPLTIE
jgi:hypothetical protein